MGLLLILSALLSAATGALTGTRGPEAPARHEAVAELVAISEAAIASPAPAGRQSPPVEPDEGPHAARADAPSAPAPLTTDRLLE